MNKKGVIRLGVIIVSIFIFVITFFSLISISSPSSALELKSQYAIGENIKIDLTQVKDYKIKITTPSTSYIKDGSNDIFIFRPEEPGEYTLTLKTNESATGYGFEVAENKVTLNKIEEIQENEKYNKTKDKTPAYLEENSIRSSIQMGEEI